MGCRAYIGMVTKRGKVKYMYVHFDGSIEVTGAILLEHFTTREQVKALIARGSARKLLSDVASMKHYNDMPKICSVSATTFLKDQAFATENMYLFHKLGVWFTWQAMTEVARWEPHAITHDVDEFVVDETDVTYAWVPLTPHLVL